MIFNPPENLDAVLGMLTRMIEESPEVHWWTIYPTRCNGMVYLRAMITQVLETASGPSMATGDFAIAPGEDTRELQVRFQDVLLDLLDLARRTGKTPFHAAPRTGLRASWGELVAAGNGSGQQGAPT